MKSRLVIVILALVAWAATVVAKLYEVQVAEHSRWVERAGEQQLREVDLAPPRGTIHDRQGRLLAVSAAVESAYVAEPQFDEPAEIVAAIAALGLETDGLEQRFTQGSWSWIARQLEPREAKRLRALEIDGLSFVAESKRFYPLGSLAGPVLGFVGVDHTGLAGVEAAYDQVVSGEAVSRPLLQDARARRTVHPNVSFVDARPGEDLHLTVDAGVQYIVERELERALERHAAKAGVAIVMDPFSGALYALASLPAFDPNRFGDSLPERWRNRAIQDTYEPGSTLKLVTAAAALERNLIDPLDVIDCEMGAIRLDRTRIRDHKEFGELSFTEVFAKSSNVGAIKVGLMIGPQAFARQMEDLGLGSASGIDLPGEAQGIVRPVSKWARHEVAYAAIGQGVAVTPLQLIRAFAAIANGGSLPRPHVVARIGDRGRPGGSQVSPESISPATVRTLVRLLEAAVESGTGGQATVPGYRVAGKTGTAQISVAGGYAPDRHVASFVGFAPSRDPKLVGLVTIFEPRGLYHGGDVAAPVFAAIFDQVLPLLGVLPERTEGDGAMVAARGVEAPRVGRAEQARRVVGAGEVPDFTGLTARQALALGAELGLEVRLRGSGFVADQSPAAGQPVETVSAALELQLTDGRAG